MPAFRLSHARILLLTAALAAGGLSPASARAVRPALRSQALKPGSPPAALSDRALADSICSEVIDRLITFTDAHWHKGEYNHIVNLSRMVVAGRPGEVEVYANAGWLLWSMDRDAEAVALYEQGIRSNPNTSYLLDEAGHYYYNRKKDYATAIRYYERAVAFADVKPFTVHLLAHAYERNGQPEKALKVWERAARDPEDRAALVNLQRVRRSIESHKQ